MSSTRSSRSRSDPTTASPVTEAEAVFGRFLAAHAREVHSSFWFAIDDGVVQLHEH